ncbi:hypothetical protein [Lactiplantibacillus herbarum]|uniref:hypothetical protein n=1 Tax=Lactiplantibacillus herbarum TaxID=1670446 RepID=UPI00064EAE1B|nr:hypothetical protein [Lactiplantibacillus herbarum]
MRKSIITLITLTLLVLSGCSTKSQKSATTSLSVKATTEKTIKSASKTWTFSQSVTSKQTKKNGVDNQLTTAAVSRTGALTNWTTAKGQFMSYAVKYQRVSLTKWQKDQRSHYVKDVQKNIHYMSVAQVNAVLKKLGADFKISKLSDLIFLETKTSGMPVDQAFVAKGHHLYGINIQYMTADQTITINRGTSFTDTSTKKAANHVAVSKLNGTWIAAETTTSSSDTGKIMIKDGYLYQHRYDSFERSAIQDLSHYSLTSLNQNNTYASQKSEAANGGYQLTAKSVASGDSLGYLYLFVSENKLIRIGQGQTTTYQKTSTTVAVADLPQSDLKIYDTMDQRYPSSPASTITVKADAPIIGLTDSIKYLTDADAGQITRNATN